MSGAPAIIWRQRGAVVVPEYMTKSGMVRGVKACAAAWLAQQKAGWTGAYTVVQVWAMASKTSRALAILDVRMTRPLELRRAPR